MKTQLLFPTYLKIPGLILFLAGLTLFIACMQFGYEAAWLDVTNAAGSLTTLSDTTHNYTLSLALSLLLSGLIFLGFSKMRSEDEMIALMRLRALQLSIYITVLSFLVVTLFTFSFAFLTYAMWLWYSFLLLYCAIFYAKLYSLKFSTKSNEE